MPPEPAAPAASSDRQGSSRALAFTMQNEPGKKRQEGTGLSEPKSMEGLSKLPLATSLPSETFTADAAGAAARRAARSQLHRRVPAKYDPLLYDLAVLLELKHLATPSRWSAIEDLAEILYSGGRKVINVSIEQRISRHAELLKDRARYRSYLLTGMVPKAAPEDRRCWEEEALDLPDHFGEEDCMEAYKSEPLVQTDLEVDHPKKRARRLEFKSKEARSSRSTLFAE